MLQDLNVLKCRWSLIWHQYRLETNKWATLAQDWLFWRKNATAENACMPPDPSSGSRLRRSKLASSCSEVWLRPWRDNRKNPEYRVIVAIRKLRTDTNCLAGNEIEVWPPPYACAQPYYPGSGNRIFTLLFSSVLITKPCLSVFCYYLCFICYIVFPIF